MRSGSNSGTGVETGLMSALCGGMALMVAGIELPLAGMAAGMGWTVAVVTIHSLWIRRLQK
jgi:hypothetical protein